MNTKQKCLYTLLGAGIMLCGTLLGGVFGGLNAEFDKVGVYRELYCNQLYILNPENGKRVAMLDHSPALRM